MIKKLILVCASLIILGLTAGDISRISPAEDPTDQAQYHLPKSKLTDNPVQIIRYLAEKNDIDPKELSALAWCESINVVAGHLDVFNFEENKHLFEKLKSIKGLTDPRDRGLFQISSRWNPDVNDKCAFDYWCATQWTIDEIKAGRSWKWVCKEIKNLDL